MLNDDQLVHRLRDQFPVPAVELPATFGNDIRAAVAVRRRRSRFRLAALALPVAALAAVGVTTLPANGQHGQEEVTLRTVAAAGTSGVAVAAPHAAGRDGTGIITARLQVDPADPLDGTTGEDVDIVGHRGTVYKQAADARVLVDVELASADGTRHLVLVGHGVASEDVIRMARHALSRAR